MSTHILGIGAEIALSPGVMTRLQFDGANPSMPYCEERRQLSEALLSAVHELMKLLGEQSKAIIDNETEFGRFDDLIHIAQSAKNNAKYALLAHIHQHQCE